MLGLDNETFHPGVSGVGGFPDAASGGAHIKRVGLRRNASHRSHAATTLWPDHSVSHAGPKRRIVLWAVSADIQRKRKQQKRRTSAWSNHCYSVPQAFLPVLLLILFSQSFSGKVLI